MNAKTLGKRCRFLFGEADGEKLADVIAELSRTGLCIATAWDKSQASISRGCTYEGRIFDFDEEYKFLLPRDDYFVPVFEVTKERLLRYLPNAKLPQGQKHCNADVIYDQRRLCVSLESPFWPNSNSF